MRTVLSVLTTLVPSLALAAAAGAAGPLDLRIDHRAAACFAPTGHPRIVAVIEPTGEVESARVDFHAAESLHWYAVEMRRDGGVWTAALPRPKGDVARFAYFITARARDSKARLPEKAAFIVDVSTSCSEEDLPVAERGPQTLVVGPGAPRQPLGFDVAGVEGFVEAEAEETPTPPPASSAPMLVVPFKHVRLTTVPPPSSKAEWSSEDDRSVTLKADPEGEQLTRSKTGRFLHGELESLEGDRLILTTAGGGRVAVRRQDIVRLEAQEPGSPGRAVVGGLVGLGSGLLLTALACVSADVCDSVNVLWLGAGVGAVIGGAAGGSPGWRALALVPQRPVSLSLQPRRRGAAVALAVRF